eukprot:Ihof_evm2s474 gene=Ihof_evmTU2s474
MRPSWIFGAVALWLAGVQALVEDLTLQDFESKVSKGVWMIEFYAPWCSHCRDLVPIWESAAEQLEGDVHFGKVNCISDSSLAKRYNIRGYPTIKAFRSGPKGEIVDFNAPRNLDSIVDFAKRLNAPDSKELPDDGLKRLGADNSEFLFVGDDSEESKKAQEIYYMVANNRKLGATFWHTTSQNIRDILGQSQYPAIVVAKDGKHIYFTGSLDYVRLDAWIMRERFTIVPEVGLGDQGTVRLADVMKAKRPIVIGLVGASNPETSAEMKTALRTVGLSLNGGESTDPLADKYSFAWVDGDKHFRFFSAEFAVKADLFPNLIMWNHETEKYYREVSTDPARFTPEYIMQFIKDCEAGKIQERGGMWDQSVKTFWTTWNGCVDIINKSPVLVGVVLFVPLMFLILAYFLPDEVDPN